MSDVEQGRPIALVVGHGDFSRGILSALDQITGRGNAFIPFSNTHLSPSEIENGIADALDISGVKVVFSDLPAGSCTMAVRRIQRSRDDIILVTGTNVAVLMDYLFAVEAPVGGYPDIGIDHRAILHVSIEKARASLSISG